MLLGLSTKSKSETEINQTCAPVPKQNIHCKYHKQQHLSCWEPDVLQVTVIICRHQLLALKQLFH